MIKLKNVFLFFLLLATSITLFSCNKTDEKLVEDVYNTLEIVYQNPDDDLSVTKNLGLITVNKLVVISWESSHPNVINTAGEVTRQTTDTTVTLSATITKGDASKVKIFTVVVLQLEQTPIQVPKGYDDVKTNRESLNINYLLPQRSALGNKLTLIEKIAYIRSLNDKVFINPNTNFTLKSEGFFKSSNEYNEFVKKETFFQRTSEAQVDFEFILDGSINNTFANSTFSLDLLLEIMVNNSTSYKETLTEDKVAMAIDGNLYITENKSYADANFMAYGNNMGVKEEIHANITSGIQSIFDMFVGTNFENESIKYPDLSDVPDSSIEEIFNILKKLEIYQLNDKHYVRYILDGNEIVELVETIVGEGSAAWIVDQLLEYELGLMLEFNEDRKLLALYLDTNVPIYNFLFGSLGNNSFESSIKLEIIFDTDETPNIPNNLNEYEEINLDELEYINNLYISKEEELLETVYNLGEDIYFYQSNNQYNYQLIRIQNVFSTYVQSFDISIENSELNLKDLGTYQYISTEFSFEYTVIEPLKYDDLKGVYKAYDPDFKDFTHLYLFIIKIGDQEYVYCLTSDENYTDQELFDLYGNLDVSSNYLSLINLDTNTPYFPLNSSKYFMNLEYFGDGFYSRYFYINNHYYSKPIYFEQILGQTVFPSYKGVTNIELIDNDIMFDVISGIDSLSEARFIVAYTDGTTKEIEFNQFEYNGFYIDTYNDEYVAIVELNYYGHSYMFRFELIPQELVGIKLGAYFVTELDGEKCRVVIEKTEYSYIFKWTVYSGPKNFEDVTYEDFKQDIAYFDFETFAIISNDKLIELYHFYNYNFELTEDGFVMSNNSYGIYREFVFIQD